jgi:hypothetical protein
MRADACSVALSRQPSAHRFSEDNLSPKARMKYVKNSSHDVTRLSEAGTNSRRGLLRFERDVRRRSNRVAFLGTNTSAAGTNSIPAGGRGNALEF